MKKKKEFEIWANKQLKEIQNVLLLNDFRLMPISISKDPNVSTSSFRYPYKEIIIRYAPEVYEDWENGNKDQAMSVLIHEMLHPLTDKIYAVAHDRFVTNTTLENERENLTDHIANIIIKLLKHDKKDNKRIRSKKQKRKTLIKKQSNKKTSNKKAKTG